MKKILSAALALCIMLPFCSFAYSAQPQGSIPSAYDSRDYGLVTPVKSQGPYGTCWAHAICAVAESNMLKKGLAQPGVDYSELQLAYFLLNQQDDPLGNFTDEGAFLTDLAKSRQLGFLSVGSDAGLAGFSLMTGIGLVDEADVPYSSVEQVRQNGLDSSYAYSKTTARLSNIYFLSYSQPQVIKQAIIDNGALWTSLYDNTGDKETPCFNEETGAYYKASGYDGAQHAVTIVGWDDDYAVNNFLESSRPQKPGAWLIKDSAGEDFGIGGYWWASYEDVDFCLTSTKKVAVMDFTLPETYQRTYQYDGGSRNAQFGAPSNGKDQIYMANVFTSVKDERITAVSFGMSLYPNKAYTIDIYKNPTAADSQTNTIADPASGDHIYSSSGVTPEGGGYFTVPVTKDLRLKKGDTFSVIIGYKGEDELGTMYMDYDSRSDGEGSYFGHKSSHKAGQSFYATEINPDYNDWIDMAYWDDPAHNGGKLGNSNFRIKAHTADITPSAPELTITSAPSKLAYVEGNSLDLSGLKVSYRDESGALQQITDYQVSPANGKKLSLADNAAQITVTYAGLSALAGTLAVSAKSAVSLAIASPPLKTSYVEGDAFSPEGMQVKLNYNNGESALVSGYTVTPSGALTTGDTFVVVEYNGLSATQAITVEAKAQPKLTIWQRILNFFRKLFSVFSR